MTTPGGGDERALCGIRINHVTAVQKRRWPADWRDAFLNLLALKLWLCHNKIVATMELSFLVAHAPDNKTDRY